MRRPAASITGEQLNAAMYEIGWNVEVTADWLGQRQQRIRQWLHDEVPIPRWVPVFFTAMTVPEAKAKAETVHHFLNEQEHNHGMDTY